MICGCSLDLPFKGSRQYVHGTDILDKIMELIDERNMGELRDIEYSMHKQTSNNLRLQYETDAPDVAEKDIVAVLRMNAAGRLAHFSIRLDKGEPEARIAYDESIIVAKCDIDKKMRCITLNGSVSKFSPIEILVAMNKALHLATLKKTEDSIWLFCRWQSPQWPLPDNLTGVKIHLIQTLGTRLTRADAVIDSRLIGQLFFSAKKIS